MKTLIRATFIVVLMGIFAACLFAEQSLPLPGKILFSAHYDNGDTNADYAKGSSVSDELDPAYDLNGKFGKAVTLKGCAYLSYEAQDNLDNKQGTISLWVKPEWAPNDNQYHYFLELVNDNKEEVLRLLKHGNNALYLYSPAGEMSLNISTWKPGEWHHLVFTWNNMNSDAGEIVFFIDGSEVGRKKASSAWGNILLFYVGNNYFTSYYSIGGSIDELSVFSRVLSLPEIESLYKITGEEVKSYDTLLQREDKPNWKKVIGHPLPLPKERPLVKDGCFWLDGKRTFLNGTQHAWGVGQAGFRARKPGYDPKNAVYEKWLDKEGIEKYGLDAVEVWLPIFFEPNPPANAYPEEIFSGSGPWPQQTSREHYHEYAVTTRKLISQLDGIPLHIDYSCLGSLRDWSNAAIKKGFKDVPLPANCDGHLAYSFSICSEDPLGWKVYRDVWQRGAKEALSSGGNSWLYELANEAGYGDFCSYNRTWFKDWLKDRYRNIGDLNGKWGSDYKDFSEVEAVKYPHEAKYKGLWVDWLKFLGDRAVDIFQGGKKAIQEVDKRDRTYYFIQVYPTMMTQPFTLGHGNCIDQYKLAQVEDVISIGGYDEFGYSPLISVAKKQDPNLDVVVSMGDSKITDMARALGENKKPVLNPECGTFRFDEGGKITTKQKGDLLTFFWDQTIHGCSATMIFTWSKHANAWRNKEEALNFMQMGNTPAANNLLIPYDYPPEVLNEMNQFKSELDLVGDILLPMPRIQGKVALLVSQATTRIATIKDNKYEEDDNNHYKALLFSHLPLDIIFEEQLQKDWHLKKNYQALILPTVQAVYPETLPILTDYVKKGGVVICNNSSLSLDEFGKAIDVSSFLGLTRTPKPSTPVSFNLGIRSKDSKKKFFNAYATFNITPTTAKVIGTTEEGSSFATVNQVGGGKVYYFAGRVKGYALENLLISLLSNAGIEKPADVCDQEGNFLENMELQIIDRGATKLYYLRGQENLITKLVLLKIVDAKPGVKYFISSPTENRLFASPSGKDFWNVKELSSGIKVIVPPQFRTVLLIREGNAFGNNLKQISPAETEKEFTKTQNAENGVLLTEAAKLQEVQTKDFASRNFTGVDKNRCVSIDLSSAVNMSFIDEFPGDKKGGWDDNGPDNDMRDVPVGDQVFGGVPFHVINPKENDNKSVLMLYGNKRDFFPKEAKGIAVNLKAKNLYFLHAACWAGGNIAWTYVVNYEDGSKIEMPVIYKKNYTDWLNPGFISEAKLVWETIRSVGNESRAGLYCQRWNNPQPDKKVRSIDIVSGQTDTVPAIVAITAEY